MDNNLNNTPLPSVTADDLQELEDVISGWHMALELLDDEILNDENSGVTRPFDFMKQFRNFVKIPFSPYMLYRAEDGSMKIYDRDGKVLVHNLDKVYHGCDCVVIYENDGKCGLIDFDHQDVVIPAEYDDIDYDGTGSTYIFTKDGKEGH